MAQVEPMSPLHDATARILTKSLDAAALRHRVIADNLANVETPGFKARDVAFSEHLQAALESAQDEADAASAHAALEAVEPTLVLSTDGAPSMDGNTVDVDVEMTKLTENAGVYTATAQMLRARLEMLRTVINEGRR